MHRYIEALQDQNKHRWTIIEDHKLSQRIRHKNGSKLCVTNNTHSWLWWDENLNGTLQIYIPCKRKSGLFLDDALEDLAEIYNQPLRQRLQDVVDKITVFIIQELCTNNAHWMLDRKKLTIMMIQEQKTTSFKIPPHLTKDVIDTQSILYICPKKGHAKNIIPITIPPEAHNKLHLLNTLQHNIQ